MANTLGVYSNTKCENFLKREVIVDREHCSSWKKLFRWPQNDMTSLLHARFKCRSRAEDYEVPTSGTAK